ncbi:exosome complex component RRP45 [Orussus abietinus]|uniref:exosome complex component RRP45 n=1 Tax=Orussus abietinus TaxID=222816 RepID=UPI0006263202|nr:exosome complex component RRP45 [Orussus abietinus]
MREFPLSECERNFVTRAAAEDTRLDGRALLESRPVKIYFGSNWGCCLTVLGQTRVVAQVSCDIQQPKASRPNEGMLYINVELNPLAAPHFEGNRQSDIAVVLNRQLEKCFKDSKCIDLESLCIVADKQAWNIRVDVSIINHDGNLIDCASIATLAALSHFHRPDVTATGNEIIVHPFSEKDPLPMTLFHYPVCVSFITFENGKIVMDPTYLEERIAVAQLTMGINSYRELCCLYFEDLAKIMVDCDIISEVSDHAADWSVKLVQQIKAAVSADVNARYRKEECPEYRFKDCVAVKNLKTLISERVHIKLAKWERDPRLDDEGSEMDVSDDEIIEYDEQIIKLGEGSAELVTPEMND